MQLQFLGAAREVTGSCHLVQIHGQQILLDCGLFQGRRHEVQEKNRRLPHAVDRLDAIILSHAHIDHAGRLPFLVKEGYAGPIFATPATRDLCEVMLADSAHIQEKDADFLARRGRPHEDPLYVLRDVETTLSQMSGEKYEHRFEVVPGVHATFFDAGHILGSASVLLDWEENGRTQRLVFSGDIGRNGLAIIGDPVPPGPADWVICESTYGNRDHSSVEGAREQLAAVVRDTAARGGRILIPAFAVGRTQELLYDLHQLVHEGKIPPLPIFIDSPLATKATAVFEANTDVYDADERFVQTHEGDRNALLKFELVTFTPSIEDSKAILTQHGPMIVIAASGMAESGRILHHLAHGASDPRNTILIVGFQAEHTLGRRIVERRPMIKVFGDEVALRAQVEVLNGYSAHADRGELRGWLAAVREQSPSAPEIFLVHGEAEAQDAFQAQLKSDGYSVTVPEPGARVTRS